MFEHPKNRWRSWSTVMIAIAGTLFAGCSATGLDRFRLWHLDDWAADYETAERRAEELGAPRVLYFKSQGLAREDPVFDALQSPAIQARLDKHVRGTLVQSHEPDRRYAAQFGIQRAPAVIIVHSDGTYHALTGLIDSDSLARFLDQATPPGTAPATNPLVPRKYAYTWISDFDTAKAQSEQQGKPLVVTYERRLLGDSRRLAALLETREVGVRLADFVHCRVSLLPTVGDAFISPFGAIRLPAIVIVYPDGRSDVLEMPTSSDAIARFVDASRRGDIAPIGSPSASSTTASAP